MNRLLISLALVLCLFGCDSFEKRQTEIQKREERTAEVEAAPYAMPLPIIGKRVEQAGFDVWELPHGWIVKRSIGYSGGLTFVPKPEKEIK